MLGLADGDLSEFDDEAAAPLEIREIELAALRGSAPP